MRGSKALSLILLPVVWASTVAVRADEYRVTDLGSVVEAYRYRNPAYDPGRLAGYAITWDGSTSRTLLAGPGGGPPRVLGTLGGSFTAGSAANTSGQVVGQAAIAGDAAFHAFLSAPGGGTLMDLGTLGGRNSDAEAVNARGQVTGLSDLGEGNPNHHAFVSGPGGGGLIDLGTFGGRQSEGVAINASGEVAGTASNANQNPHAFLSAPGGGYLRDLGSLGSDSSVATALNDRGQVVGYSYAGPGYGGAQHAFIYNEKNWYSVMNANNYPSRRDPLSGVMIDLNSLIAPGAGFTIASATGIGNDGSITAIATDGAGHEHLVILGPTVVPGPPAVILLGTGLWVLRRRRKPAG